MAYVCKECKSEDLEIQMWVNINTLEIQDDVLPMKVYCNKCNDLVKHEEKADESNDKPKPQ